MASPLILPNGFSSEKHHEPLVNEDVAAILAFEAMCARHHLEFAVGCVKCKSYCQASNKPGTPVQMMACNCTKYVYTAQPH